MHAAAAALGKAAAPLDRANSYLAVMVDDLTLQGVSEPYRMLTARAEYRLRLRANNAATRLTPLAIAAGCVGEERQAQFMFHVEQCARVDVALGTLLSPRALAEQGFEVKTEGEPRTGREWLRVDGVSTTALGTAVDETIDWTSDAAQEVVEDALYAPYLERQDAELRDLRAGEALGLGADFPYASTPGLSNEMIQRLGAARPATLAAAGRVPGVTPAALAALLVHARRRAGQPA
jgi:tRNA uridine 5-carboxymethylaminomethyl modification enzyme